MRIFILDLYDDSDEYLRVFTVLEAKLKDLDGVDEVTQKTRRREVIRDLDRIIDDEMMCIMYDPWDMKYISVKEASALLLNRTSKNASVYSFAQCEVYDRIHFTFEGSAERTVDFLVDPKGNYETRKEILSFQSKGLLHQFNKIITKSISSLLPQLTKLRILDIHMPFLRQSEDYRSGKPGLFNALKEVKSLEGLSIQEIDGDEIEDIPTIFSVTSSHQHLRYILFDGSISETTEKSYRWDGLGALNESDLFSPSLRVIVFKSTTSHTISKSFIDNLELDKIKEPSEVLLIMNQWNNPCRFMTECYQMLNRISFQTFPKSLHTTHIMTKGDLPPLFSRNVQNLVLSNSRIENEEFVGSKAKMKEVLDGHKNLKTLTIVDTVKKEDPTAWHFEGVYRACKTEHNCEETERSVVVKRYNSCEVYMSSLLNASLNKSNST